MYRPLCCARRARSYLRSPVLGCRRGDSLLHPGCAVRWPFMTLFPKLNEALTQVTTRCVLHQRGLPRQLALLRAGFVPHARRSRPLAERNDGVKSTIMINSQMAFSCSLSPMSDSTNTMLIEEAGMRYITHRAGFTLGCHPRAFTWCSRIPFSSR